MIAAFCDVCVICFQILLEVWQQKTRNGWFRSPCLLLRASSSFGASIVSIGTCALVFLLADVQCRTYVSFTGLPFKGGHISVTDTLT